MLTFAKIVWAFIKAKWVYLVAGAAIIGIAFWIKFLIEDRVALKLDNQNKTLVINEMIARQKVTADAYIARENKLNRLEKSKRNFEHDVRQAKKDSKEFADWHNSLLPLNVNSLLNQGNSD